jgi:putative transposase
MAVPQDLNQRWSLDFASDALTRWRFSILVVVDDFTRQCLTLVADTSVGGTSCCSRTRRDRCCLWAASGVCIRRRTELTSTAIHRRSQDRGIDCTTSHRETILHRTAARRVPERDAIFPLARAPRSADRTEGRLQHRLAALARNLPPAAYAKRSDPVMQRDGSLRNAPVASPALDSSNAIGTLPSAGTEKSDVN